MRCDRGWLNIVPRLAGFALLLTGCQRPAGEPSPRFDPAAIDGRRARAEVAAFVALGPRDSGTPGAQKAAEWIAARVGETGLETRINEFQEQTPHGPMTFRNVIATRAGDRRDLIIVGAHYDTKSGIPDFQGANDSGSGVGLLIEIARALAAAPAGGPEIRLAFFDGEECRDHYGPGDGLHGSRRMALELARSDRAGDVKAVLVLDMIGDRHLTVTLPRNGAPPLFTAVFDAARAEGVRNSFRFYEGPILDDHEPFRVAGFPVVDLIDFEYGSAPGRNDYWHTPQDSLDKLSAESLAIVGRVTIRVLNTFQPKGPAE